MIAASQPRRRREAKLLHIDSMGRIRHLRRAGFTDLLSQGDVVVANDAATLPASLHGTHEASGAAIEVRLAGRQTLATMAVTEFTAVVFGAGDHRTRTEDRPAPPPLRAGDRLLLGTLNAIVVALLGHPRLILLRFAATTAQIWQGLALHGRPIQYAHVPAPVALWDVWTAIAGPPVAYETPSAGFALDWRMLEQLRAKGVLFTTLTHAAGISSTGDPALDARLPFDEPYLIPPATAAAINRARGRSAVFPTQLGTSYIHVGRPAVFPTQLGTPYIHVGRSQRVIAVGTTVVRALEHAGQSGVVRAGAGLATQRLNEQSQLQIVDAVLSGTHEIGTSHHELLRAFTTDGALRRADDALTTQGYLTHEFGDSVLIERSNPCAREMDWLNLSRATAPQCGP